jgi:hypothetical protein
MDDLIKALTIFRKYLNTKWPTHCEHDVMYIIGVTKEEVSEEDLAELDELGFFWDGSDKGFKSYRFGSA